ncbi:hypothetical protein AMJ86_09505 [bacterium SM23_57]|nr:MAG: hypothetical protein AMJ86_09505 [bacterium SM23_57]
MGYTAHNTNPDFPQVMILLPSQAKYNNMIKKTNIPNAMIIPFKILLPMSLPIEGVDAWPVASKNQAVFLHDYISNIPQHHILFLIL